jgi:hypothetical protein
MPTTATAPAPAAGAEPPPLPYTVDVLPYGADPPVMRPVKVRNGLHGEMLTPEEIAVWEHLQWLNQQLLAATEWKALHELDEATKPQ